MKRLIVDVDDTICVTNNGDYKSAIPIEQVIQQLREYQSRGFQIVLHSSRNMRTYEGNVGKINAHSLPILVEWLIQHNVPYDEIYMGKPWCGREGFYVDDKAIRPKEFANMSYEEIQQILKEGRI